MTLEIRPIQTHYAGCLFRSRLEARWAVFFDRMDIPWQYEPQGYQLSSGTWYLPDFYLPECSTWVEVKGHEAALDKPMLELAAAELPREPPLSEWGPNMMFLGPIPAPREGTDFGWFGFDFRGDEPEAWPSHWSFGLYSKNHRPWWVGGEDRIGPGWLDPCLDPDTYDVYFDAYVAARSARF